MAVSGSCMVTRRVHGPVTPQSVPKHSSDLHVDIEMDDLFSLECSSWNLQSFCELGSRLVLRGAS